MQGFDPATLMVYYPLIAALFGMAAWLGQLSEKVKNLAKLADGIASLGGTVAKLEHSTTQATIESERNRTAIESLQRQIANLMLRLPVSGIHHADVDRG